jgi:hypothetical protein
MKMDIRPLDEGATSNGKMYVFNLGRRKIVFDFFCSIGIFEFVIKTLRNKN